MFLPRLRPARIAENVTAEFEVNLTQHRPTSAEVQHVES
jgi:hypothetical protein